MIRQIPLKKLKPSPRNVRRVIDEQADLQLKADIESRGLLQNLVVAPASKPRGSFTVEAGGRRLRALISLFEERKLPATHEVCCLVIEGGMAEVQEAGLAENFQRLAMNPADECLAFGQLIEQGADVEGIAWRFGLTVRFVEGRLRLSALAPAVFEALGAGEITLDVAKAYAATPDRERQAWVFEQVGFGYSGAHPDSIRRMMTQATASATDRRARFVGEEAYVAADGRIERDLFSEDQATRWLDVAILERLACEKLEALARDAAAENSLAWVRATLDNWIGHGHLTGLHQVPVDAARLSDEEEARIETLEAGIEALAATIHDESVTDEQREAAEAQIESGNEAIRAIVDKPPVLEPEVRATAGTFLLLGDDGQPRLHTSFYQERAPEDAPDPGRSPAQVDPGADRERDRVTPAKPVLSQRLKEELSMQRRDILAAHVAAAPDLAFDLAIFLMVDPIDGYTSERSGSSLFARHPTDPVLDFRMPDALATVALARMAEGLDRSWAGHDTRAERFDAFRALGDEARAAWLAHAAARTLEASLGSCEAGGCAFHDHLAHLLEIEHEYLAVPDRACPGGLLDGLDHASRKARGDRDLEPHLRDEARRIFRAAIDFGLPPLPAESPGFGNGHSLNAKGGQSIADFVELVGFDDGDDLLHAAPIHAGHGSARPAALPRGNCCGASIRA